MFDFVSQSLESQFPKSPPPELGPSPPRIFQSRSSSKRNDFSFEQPPPPFPYPPFFFRRPLRKVPPLRINVRQINYFASLPPTVQIEFKTLSFVRTNFFPSEKENLFLEDFPPLFTPIQENLPLPYSQRGFNTPPRNPPPACSVKGFLPLGRNDRSILFLRSLRMPPVCPPPPQRDSSFEINLSSPFKKRRMEAPLFD